MTLGETSRPPQEQTFGVNQKTQAESEQIDRSLSEQEQKKFSKGVKNFRKFYLEALAQSDLSGDESKTFNYEETDGHWEAVGNIPNPDGSIHATFSVGLKSRTEEGVHEPFAIIAFPHDLSNTGHARNLHDHPEAIRQIFVSVGDYLRVNPAKLENALGESDLLNFPMQRTQ